MPAPTEQELQELRTALKRCSVETQEAAILFRTTGDLAALPTLVYGIIERHLPPENERLLAEATDATRLIEDLGIDSLSMLEIVLSIEETINISIENEELREIRTLGEVKSFIARKIAAVQAGVAAPTVVKKHYTRLDIGMRIPQQPPFFFLDEAEIEGDVVRAKYLIVGDEAFLEGHFKDNPIMPASIVFEAVGQAACLWIIEYAPIHLQKELGTNEVLFAALEDAHFYRRAKPGDILEMEATMTRVHAPLVVFRCTVKVGGKRLAEIGRLVLAFGNDAVEHLDQLDTADASGKAQGNPKGVKKAAKKKPVIVVRAKRPAAPSKKSTSPRKTPHPVAGNGNGTNGNGHHVKTSAVKKATRSPARR